MQFSSSVHFDMFIFIFFKSQVTETWLGEGQPSGLCVFKTLFHVIIFHCLDTFLTPTPHSSGNIMPSLFIGIKNLE